MKMSVLKQEFFRDFGKYFVLLKFTQTELWLKYQIIKVS